MTENEAIKELSYDNTAYGGRCTEEVRRVAIHALSEIQQYREYKEIFKSHFSKEALELLRDKEEFGKWLERGKWIAKKCDEINRKLEGFEAIGTIEEFKALKEKNEPKKIDIWANGEEHCPFCDKNLTTFYGFANCFSCGQKLDWQ